MVGHLDAEIGERGEEIGDRADIGGAPDDGRRRARPCPLHVGPDDGRDHRGIAALRPEIGEALGRPGLRGRGFG